MSNVDQVAHNLHKAMKGLGTDEKKIIREICGINNYTRQLVKERYFSLFGKTLKDELKSEIKGEFLQGVLALLEEHDIYEAKNLHKAISGLGTNEKVVIQTICSKEVGEIARLRETYNNLFNNQIDQHFAKEESGELGQIFKSIIACERSNAYEVDIELAQMEAQQLYNAGEGVRGTNEAEFRKILVLRSFPQLRATFDAYLRLTGHDFEVAIKKEFSGNLKIALLAIVRSAKNKAAYFAKELHYAMKGIGTNDDDLIRILVSRSEIDLHEIKYHFHLFYGKKLYDVVKSELKGDYETLFLTLIGK